MVDYVDAFRKGLEAAEAADRARKEIDAVFDELNLQIQKDTDGKIRIERQEFTLSQQGLEAIFRSKPPEKYLAIVAHNPSLDKSPVRELSRWSQARGGYPCNMVWGNKDQSCFDRESLENLLSELLRDPLVGEHLQALMQMKSISEEKG